MTRSMLFVVPAQLEYAGLWRSCRGRVVKSYPPVSSVPQLEDVVFGVFAKLGVLGTV